MTKLRWPSVTIFLTSLAGFAVGFFSGRLSRTRSNLAQYLPPFLHDRPETLRAFQKELTHVIQRIVSFPINVEVFLYGTLGVIALGAISAIVIIHLTRHTEPTRVAAQTMKDAKEPDEDFAGLKAELLNQVSHELRTPLAVIIGYIECIMNGLYGHLGPKHQEVLETVAKQSSQLKETIDHLLIYSRLDSNREALQVKEFRLDQTLNVLRETCTALCKQKNVKLNWQTPDAAIKLTTDPQRLKQILSHLLQNAVKYTDEGSICFRTCLNDRERTIEFDISDTGVGIAKNYLNAIFEPFFQVRRSSAEGSRGGIGLGLSIVKRDLEKLNGTITVQSESGRGSRFTVSIPLRLKQPSKHAEQLFSLTNFTFRRRSSQRLTVFQATSSTRT